MIIKEATHGRWEQTKKRLFTKTYDGLANYLLDLYLNNLPSLPHIDQYCTIEATRYANSASLIYAILILNSQRERVNEDEGDIPLGRPIIKDTNATNPSVHLKTICLALFLGQLQPLHHAS